MIRGGYKYVPRELLQELENVKLRFNIRNDAECFRKIAENSRIGREIRFTIDFNIKKNDKR